MFSHWFCAEVTKSDVNRRRLRHTAVYAKIKSNITIGYTATAGHLTRLLITFANSLDPDQARQNIGPDLDPKCLTL